MHQIRKKNPVKNLTGLFRCGLGRPGCLFVASFGLVFLRTLQFLALLVALRWRFDFQRDGTIVLNVHLHHRPEPTVLDALRGVLLAQPLQQRPVQPLCIGTLHGPAEIRPVPLHPMVQGELADAKYFQLLIHNRFHPALPAGSAFAETSSECSVTLMMMSSLMQRLMLDA
uniref:Uncharacterized protein n=1 Tax=Anopheles atroparvus TaxID=41427 RepID=A0A182JES8_ANOAO